MEWVDAMPTTALPSQDEAQEEANGVTRKATARELRADAGPGGLPRAEKLPAALDQHALPHSVRQLSSQAAERLAAARVGVLAAIGAIEVRVEPLAAVTP